MSLIGGWLHPVTADWTYPRAVLEAIGDEVLRELTWDWPPRP